MLYEPEPLVNINTLASRAQEHKLTLCQSQFSDYMREQERCVASVLVGWVSGQRLDADVASSTGYDLGAGDRYTIVIADIKPDLVLPDRSGLHIKAKEIRANRVTSLPVDSSKVFQTSAVLALLYNQTRLSQ